MFPSAEKIQIILPVISLLFLALSFKRTIYGAVSYFIVLNAKIGDMYPELGKYRFELIVAIVVLFSILVNRRGIANWISRDSRVIKFTWLLFVIGMISVPQAVDINVSWEYGGYSLLKLMLFFMMIVASIHEVNDVRIIVWAYILMGVWIAYEPVTNYIQGVVVVTGYGGVAYGRFGAAAGHVALANTLSQSLPLTYFQAAVEKNRNLKLILYGAMLLMVAGIFASRSRGGFVGLTVFIMGVYLFTKKKTRGLIVLTVVILLAVFLGDELYWNRVSTISQGISSGRSANERYLGLINGISMMVKRPLFGVGIGCYAEARRQYFNYYFYSHNLYGELFGELGLASAVWFYWIYIIMKKAKRIKNNIEENQFGNQLLVHERGNYLQNILMGVQVGIVVRLVLGLGSHSAFIWFWFMMAGLVSAIEIMEKNKNLLVEG